MLTPSAPAHLVCSTFLSSSLWEFVKHSRAIFRSSYKSPGDFGKRMGLFIAGDVCRLFVFVFHYELSIFQIISFVFSLRSDPTPVFDNAAQKLASLKRLSSHRSWERKLRTMLLRIPVLLHLLRFSAVSFSFRLGCPALDQAKMWTWPERSWRATQMGLAQMCQAGLDITPRFPSQKWTHFNNSSPAFSYSFDSTHCVFTCVPLINNLAIYTWHWHQWMFDSADKLQE